MYKLEEADYSEWNKLLRRCSRVNLLQMWEYGKAKRIVEEWKPTRYIISNDGEPLGLVQALTKTFPLLGGVVRINRGPLLFPDTHGSKDLNETIEKTMQAILREIVEKKKCYLTIAPEVKEGEDSSRILKRLGFKSLGTIPWSSAVIDLSLSKDALLKNLRGKWRNLLRKSEKMGLELEQTPADEAIEFLMERYRSIQREKGFTGVPEDILVRLKRLIKSDDQMQILFARKDGIRVAGILIVGHGDNCTYLVGWNTPEGRRLQANYFLLWRAILSFKDFGYRWFDLGGICKEKTPSIAHFKTGLGGEDYRLIGEWSAAKYSLIPLVFKLLSKFRRFPSWR